MHDAQDQQIRRCRADSGRPTPSGKKFSGEMSRLEERKMPSRATMTA
ncbi:MAG: hypothetical protein ACLT3Y_06990 [Ruminococcus callidus]